MIVFCDVHSSNRIEYPTSSPIVTSISSATRFATDIAATRLGCVHTTILFSFVVYPASTRNWGICVVFPDPVSPTRTSVCEAANWERKSDFCFHTGSFFLVSRMFKYVREYGSLVYGFIISSCFCASPFSKTCIRCFFFGVVEDI